MLFACDMLVGPFRDKNHPEEFAGSGMLIFRAETREAAEALAHGCPFHSNGIRTFEIVPWQWNVCDSCLRAGAVCSHLVTGRLHPTVVESDG